MLCQNCNKETEEGKFCTNCGAALMTDDSAATVESTETPAPVQTEQVQQESNEYAEKLKDISSDFGGFFMTLLKKPSEAKNADQNALISSIIVIAIFSILVALNGYISISNYYNEILGSASFADDFLIPLLKYIILFALIPLVTFVASKISAQEVSLPTIFAKYGSYLVPFLLLYVVGIIFTLIKLGFPFTAVTSISILGPVLIVPALIILEKPVKVFDRMYVLVALSIVSYIIFGYLSSSGLGGILSRLGF